MVDIVRAVLQCMPKICPNNSTANLSLNVVAKLPTRLLSCTFQASRYAADSLRCFYPVLLLSTSLAFLCSILPALCYVVLRTLVALHCFFRSVGCLLDQPASQHCSDFLTSWQGKLLTQTEPSHLVPQTNTAGRNTLNIKTPYIWPFKVITITQILLGRPCTSHH